MNNEPSFLIGEAKRLKRDGTRWLVRGRAYQDVQVGDSLSSDALNHGPIVTVAEALTFERKIPLLDRMHSGDLVLQCEPDTDLAGVEFLYRV
jgi:hypothetical protein